MFEFIPCAKGEKALKLLHAQKKRFDLIIADAEMVEIDVFKFIDTVQATLDIPIVLMSEMDKFVHARKAIEAGVCDIICTPTIQELKVIWKFVRHIKLSPKGENRRNEVEIGNERTISPKKDNDENIQKKPRWKWTDELHEKFIFALKQLDIGASPKKIIELMDVPNLAKLTVSRYLQTFRECVKEKGVTDWTQITSEMISNQIGDSKHRTLIERKQRSEQSMSRFNMQSWNSGQSNVNTATSTALTGNSNHLGQSINHLMARNQLNSGVNNMGQSINPTWYPAVNQTTNNFSRMARNQLNRGYKYAPTAILPGSSAAVEQSKNFLPLINAYSLLNQLQSNSIQTRQNDDSTQHNTASMSNWLGNNYANRVQTSGSMWNNAANVLQNSNVTGHSSTIQGINNFGMMQNANAMEFNSANQGIGGFKMIQNGIVVQNEHTEAPYQGYSIFSDVNENSIGQNHDTMGNNCVIQSVGVVGVMQNHQMGTNENMGTPYQGQGSIDVWNVYTEAPRQVYNAFIDVNENIIGQSLNAVENNSVIQSNVAVGMMQNYQIGFDECMGAPYRGQSSIGALSGNSVHQNQNALVNISAVHRNGGVGTMQSQSVNENEYSGVTYQVRNGSNAIVGSDGMGSYKRAVNEDGFVSELLNLDAVGVERNN